MSLVDEDSSALPATSEESSGKGELDFTDGYFSNFSNLESYFGFPSSEELQAAIDTCTEMFQECKDDPTRCKQLVRKLIQLKIKREELKEPAPESEENVAGHQMERRQLDLSGPQYCDRCCGLIWTSVLSGWLQCRGCGFQCHPKCVTAITRPCPKLKLPLTHGTAQVKEDPTYILTLCPEKGLSSQGYRCAECRKMVPLQPSWETAIMIRWGLCPENNPSRQCDYTGRYYCHLCHWNSLAIIPARVVHNWDFEPKKVCRASYQFLKLMMRKPCLRLETLNPHLFAFLDDLRTVKQLREEILVAKKYFLSCHVALESGLLLQLSGRMHFVEDGERYSLADLIELEQGSLVPALTAVRDAFLAHITQHCPGCRGKGYICEVCKSEEVIFPFQRKTASCPTCSALFHQDCFSKLTSGCPRCQRRESLSQK